MEIMLLSKKSSLNSKGMTLIELTAGLSLLSLIAVILLSADISFLFSTSNAINDISEINSVSNMLNQDLENLISESETINFALDKEKSLELLINSDEGSHIIKWNFTEGLVFRNQRVYNLPFKCSIYAKKGDSIFSSWKKKDNSPDALILKIKNSSHCLELLFNLKKLENGDLV